MLSDARGDVQAGTPAGLYHEDTRFLSGYALTLGGAKPEILTSGQVDYYSAGFFLTNAKTGSTEAEKLSIARHRFVGDGLHDDIVVQNHAAEPVEISLRLSFAADFADLFQVKDRRVRRKGEYERRHDEARCLLRFEHRRETFAAATTVRFTQPGRIEGDDVVFDLRLTPRERWKTCVLVGLTLDEREMVPVAECDPHSERRASGRLKRWREGVPGLKADRHLLEQVYGKSVTDMAALRLNAEVDGNEYLLPAAGLPWFMAIFGRDTLIASYQSLWVGPELVKGALIALAALQGTKEDDFKDEDPGKIHHEIRFGELTALGKRPHRPYYGTADATPLYLIVLSEYWRFTGDDDLVRTLRPNAEAALAWIDRYGDRNGDGYVEYKTRSSQGLVNEGWKDSWDGVRFHDGRIAEPPISLCEIQGYAYDAKLRAAELAEAVWGDRPAAARLRREAGDLRDRFNRDFWVPARGGFYAMGLDKDGRRIDAMTSNMGQLLWTGIVPEDRAKVVAGHLFSDEMWTGWGVRTMSKADAGYNPISYHCGTVWPHDNSLIAAGLARYGLREEANRIATAMFEAAAFSRFRLPEVFAGLPRAETRFPVEYPTACSPQAWASAAPFLWLRLMLGMEARGGTLTCDPHLPEEVGRVELRGVHAFGGHFDVTAEGSAGEVAPAG